MIWRVDRVSHSDPQDWKKFILKIACLFCHERSKNISSLHWTILIFSVSFSYNGVYFLRFILNHKLPQYISAHSFWATFLSADNCPAQRIVAFCLHWIFLTNFDVTSRKLQPIIIYSTVWKQTKRERNILMETTTFK